MQFPNEHNQPLLISRKKSLFTLQFPPWTQPTTSDSSEEASVHNIRVRPIPGMSQYTDTDTRYRYLYEKNCYESVLVSVRNKLQESVSVSVWGISVSVYRYDTDFLR